MFVMKTLILNIPEKLDLEPTETTKFLAAKLFEAGKLSLGQGAEMTGLSKPAFAEILGDYGVSVCNFPVAEIKYDADTI